MAIDMEMLSINPFWYGRERDLAAAIVKVQNEKLAELCASRPDRFGAFASLTLQFPDLAVQQLETAVKKQGLRGAAIGGSVAGTDFSDEKFHPVWAKAEELGAVLFVHPQSTPQLAPALQGQRLAVEYDRQSARHHHCPATPDLRGNSRPLPRSENHRSPWRRLSALVCGARRPCLLRLAAELQFKHHAEKKALGISEPALFRCPGVHAGGIAASGGTGRREPGRARHGSSDPLGTASGRPRLRHHCAHRQAEERQFLAATRHACSG